MNSLELRKLLLGSTLLMGSAVASSASAQDLIEGCVVTDTENCLLVEEITEAPEAEETSSRNNIIVTGSRIKRDTFSSISPIQIITSDSSIKAGLIDPAQILQQSESASGQQIDATFNGFVLDNGPGSQTLNLRGLNSSRTLVMVNGRRLAPSGVEGAPSSPSINQVPGSLVDRYDLLLDGASSIYGSDAIAGVANIILRKDFDGFEVIGNVGTTQQGGNTDYTIAGNWGGNNDRGFIGIGAEYDFREEVTLADRDFLNDCETHIEIDENGEIRRQDVADTILFDTWFNGFQSAASLQSPLGRCRTDGISGRVFEPTTFGSFYNIGGTASNIGIPGYVDQSLSGVPIDANGDGQQDYGFNEFSVNGTVLDQSFISEQKRASLMAYGEYIFEGEANVTPYFEALYTDTRVFADAGQPLLFPDVGANNPFNPCGTNGVDCGLGAGPIASDPGFIQRWNTFQRDRDPNRDGDTRDARVCVTAAGGAFDNANCTPAIFGIGAFPVGPQEVTPIVGISGDRDQVETTQKNLRLVGGFKGDIPALNDLWSLSNWSFDMSLAHSRSQGDSSRKGILEDRLYYALGNDIVTGTPNGAAPCTTAPGDVVPESTSAGCVPVNLFAESVIRETSGDFATQAERDYLFGDRTFNTVYKQTVWSGFMTGNLFDAPAGTVAAVVGAELRVDDLDSTPSAVARDGLLFGFFSDSGAKGKKTTKEVFGELDIPLVRDETLFRELDMNLSGRITDDELYGTNYTYSVKGGWRPFDSLLLKASYGTSFRAPNLRENFLLGQSGFNNFFDPCVVPPAARVAQINDPDAIYDAALDTRELNTLARCIAEGVDPTSLGLNTGVVGFTNAEITSSGNLDLEPETSDSLSLGFSFEQPFTDAFDLTLGMNYYRIEVDESIIEPSGGFIVNDCFANQRDAGTRSVLCDRINRDGDGFLDLIEGGFANIASDLVRGMDFNALLTKEFSAFDQPMEFTIDTRANHLMDRTFVDQDDDGVEQVTEFAGEFGFPSWTGRARFELDIDDTWTGSWTTRYIGSVSQDEDGIDDFANVFGIDTTDNGSADTFADTCGGPFVGDVNCRDYGEADAYFVHSGSISYRADTWRVTAGVSNIFNTEPPEVDGTEVFQVSNVPIGNGYDLFGRRAFVNVRKTF